MNKIAIISSLDYELFGDGTGNVQREQIIPTAHLVNIYDLYDAKLTILFEYGQYVAYEKYALTNPRLEEENEKIREQLISLVKRGHDVQLHYHAQWYTADYDDTNKKFNVDLDHVDISSLEYSEMIGVLKKGKSFLETLLRPHNADYRCIGFRAGSWAVKDEEKLLSALRECGFNADSSVVPNVKFESEQINFEYSDCPHHYHYWFAGKHLSKSANSSGFIEIPPYTKKNKFAFLKYFNAKYLLSKRIVSSFYVAKLCEQNFSIFRKIKKILFRDYYMADFNTMTYKTLLDMVEDVIKDKSFASEEIIPIMFIAHPKTSYNIDDLHLLFSKLKEKYGSNVEYWTYQDAIEYLVQLEHKK